MKIGRTVPFLLGLVIIMWRCSASPPAEVNHLLPKKGLEGPIEVGKISRMAFAAPIGGHYHVEVNIPERPSRLVLHGTMIPDGPGGPADTALFRAELESAEGDTHLVFQAPVHPEEWSHVSIDLDPFSGRTMELLFRSTPFGSKQRGYACWATPYVIVPGASRPNIILISLDALRADHLSCYGYHRDTSPTIDSLAARGIQFNNAVSQAPWTLPAHASIFTSQYMKTHGVSTWRESLGSDAKTMAEILRENGYLTAAIIGGALPLGRGLNQGFDEYHATCFDRAVTDPVTNNCVHGTVVEWLERYRDAPFFLFLHYWDIHDPYTPPAPYDTLYDSEYEGSVRGWQTLYGWEILRQRLPDGLDGISARDLEYIIALYDGEIRHTDRYLSRLFAHIRDLRLDKETLIIVTSDHGDEFLDHGQTGHGKSLFSELIRVPMIWVFPDGRHGRTKIDNLIQTMDILPTLLEYLDIPPPETVEGGSFLSRISHREDSDRTAFSEVIGFTPKEGSQYAVVTDSAKLIRSTRYDSYEFYDLNEDPDEKDPHAPDVSSVGQALKRQLDRFMATIVLEVRFICPGAKNLYQVLLNAVPPSDLRTTDLETDDSIEVNRDEGIIDMRIVCPEGDRDGITIKLPRTAHTHELSIMGPDGAMISPQSIVLGNGDNPAGLPLKFRDSDQRFMKSGKLDSLMRSEPGIYIWISGSDITFSEPALPDEDVDAKLRALGYIE